MSPCFHRPWCWTAAVGAPAATIRRAMPMWPLCPEKSSPRPAARAAARIRLASVAPVRPKTGAAGSAPADWIPRRARAVGFRSPQTAIGHHSDDCQVNAGPGLGDGRRFHVPLRPRRGSSPCSTSARSAWSPPGRSSSPRPSPVPSRPVGRMRPERPTRAVASVRGLGRRCRRPPAAGCTGGRRLIPRGPGGGAGLATVRQTGSVLSPGYVRRSEDRLSEPQSRRLDHRREHSVRGPGRARTQDPPSGGVGVLGRHRGDLPSPNGHDLRQLRSSWSSRAQASTSSNSARELLAMSAITFCKDARLTWQGRQAQP